MTLVVDVRRKRYRETTRALTGELAEVGAGWRRPWIDESGPASAHRTLEPNDAADLLIWNTGADIRHGGDAAEYWREEDYIRMPARERFDDCSRYYFTLFHEIAHWAGAKDRLNRRYSPTMLRCAAQAREEILCDLTAILLAADFDIPLDMQNHARYIKRWLADLSDDTEEVERARPGAVMICDYLHSLRYGNWGPWHSR